jgi:tetratricopeptide (TPR) repeat protein
MESRAYDASSSFFRTRLGARSNNIEVLLGTAFIDYVRANNFFADERAALYAAVEAVNTKPLSLAPEHALAHLGLGAVLIATSRAQQGIAECERALALDRNLAGAHALIGTAKYFIGRAEETEAHTKEALRLSPCDTFAYLWIAAAGFAKFLLNSDEEAVALLRRAIEINRNYPQAHFWLASALAHLGQLNEARDATHAGLLLNPTFTISRVRTPRQAIIRFISLSASGSSNAGARPGSQIPKTSP